MRLPSTPKAAEACKVALAATLLSSTLIATPPSLAAYLDNDVADYSLALGRAAVRLADASHPLLQSFKEPSFPAFQRSVAAVINAVPKSELAKTIDLTRDALQSVPSDKAGAFKSLGEGLSLGSCAPVPYPSELISALGQPAVAAIKSLPKDDSSICVPSVAALERVAIAASSADPVKVSAAAEQAAATWTTAAKKAGFKATGELLPRWRDVQQGIALPKRDELKAARKEYGDASKTLATLKKLQAEGPPKCFTIGCSTNYEYNLWRYDTKDDYTGEGLEKGNAILKPKGISKEDLEERAKAFSEGKM